MGGERGCGGARGEKSCGARGGQRMVWRARAGAHCRGVGSPYLPPPTLSHFGVKEEHLGGCQDPGKELQGFPQPTHPHRGQARNRWRARGQLGRAQGGAGGGGGGSKEEEGGCRLEGGGCREKEEVEEEEAGGERRPHGPPSLPAPRCQRRSCPRPRRASSFCAPAEDGSRLVPVKEEAAGGQCPWRRGAPRPTPGRTPRRARC